MHIKLHQTQQYRFWSKVKIIEDADSCWLWTDKLLSTGYGRISILGKDYRAHQISYMLEFGHFDDDLLILHRCDVRHCVRPSHLFLGDRRLNAQDRSQKGRTAKLIGTAHTSSKLTARQITSMRKRYRQGKVMQKDLAKYYGVSKSTISYAIRGISYSDIPLTD